MRRRAGAARRSEGRRSGQADQELGHVGCGIVDSVVDDLRQQVDRLIDLLRGDAAETDHQRPAVEQGGGGDIALALARL